MVTCDNCGKPIPKDEVCIVHRDGDTCGLDPVYLDRECYKSELVILMGYRQKKRERDKNDEV